jgi:uncharacterized protein (DUF433 family)
MTRAEKAQLLQWVVRDLGEAFPGIESIPGVCGGEACIVRTRIPVWVLEQSRRLGMTEADLLRSYPTLHATDLANAWAYVQSHAEEIAAQIQANKEDTDFLGQADRIHAILLDQENLAGQLIRVNRPCQ